jgi:NADPH2 dehydrogenase
LTPIKRIAQLKTAQEFQAHLDACGARIPFDEVLEPSGPLAQSFALNDGRTIGNRFCILPMEGWDGTSDGFPSELTVRRWERFGLSGAKLIWGGEAVAVNPEGRANPNQLMLNRDTAPAIERQVEDGAENPLSTSDPRCQVRPDRRSPDPQ